jgi:ABC transporter substrate binding protein
MRRRTFITLLGSAATWPLAARAQQSSKVPRIGFLDPLSRSSLMGMGWREAFLSGLHDLGYVEGKNIIIEYRWSEGKYDRLPGLTAELVRLGIDILVTYGTPATRAAKQATTTIPIVMAISGDAIATGLIISLNRPGGRGAGQRTCFASNTRTRACARYGVLVDGQEMTGFRARIRAILLERERREAAVREAIERLISRGPPTGSGIPFEAWRSWLACSAPRLLLGRRERRVVASASVAEPLFPRVGVVRPFLQLDAPKRRFRREKERIALRRATIGVRVEIAKAGPNRQDRNPIDVAPASGTPAAPCTLTFTLNASPQRLLAAP